MVLQKYSESQRRKVVKNANKLAKTICRSTALMADLFQEPPSMVAVAIIHLTRDLFQISPAWSQRLKDISDADEGDILVI